ncbi:AAA family ATPase [Streptomyces sp. CA-111067]|uniref:AAA family ATPase n=1 Tax=Streptomyces sp. CA-111067 TaxID=3240046 RepID=UPI003D98DEB0
MTERAASPHDIAILPYSRIVGQQELKLALELNYVAPAVGGVLITGQPGTAKSTVVRAFSLMARGRLPVTLTIDATDDRVLGGWDLDALLQGRATAKTGLLEAAHREGLLYIDEVNLLNDHVVNIILDVASTGVLSVQREGIDKVSRVRFGLVGTMNPEEGGLRPQLLDRFGLMAVAAPLDADERLAMLRTVLRFESEQAEQAEQTDLAQTEQAQKARQSESVHRSDWLAEAHRLDLALRDRLADAQRRLPAVRTPDAILRRCVAAAEAVQAVGHRGEVVMAHAARAYAALHGADEVTTEHLAATAPLALRHRRPDSVLNGSAVWSQDDHALLDDLLS